MDKILIKSRIIRSNLIILLMQNRILQRFLLNQLGTKILTKGLLILLINMNWDMKTCLNRCWQITLLRREKTSLNLSLCFKKWTKATKKQILGCLNKKSFLKHLKLQQPSEKLWVKKQHSKDMTFKNSWNSIKLLHLLYREPLQV